MRTYQIAIKKPHTKDKWVIYPEQSGDEAIKFLEKLHQKGHTDETVKALTTNLDGSIESLYLDELKELHIPDSEMQHIINWH